MATGEEIHAVLRQGVDHDKVVFDFFCQMFETCVFAYLSLEAFVNESLSDNAVYNKKVKRLYVPVDKARIQKDIPLGTKLADILPDVFDVPSPKGTDIWEAFLRLERLRHRVVHIKDEDRKDLAHAPDNIWQELIKSPPNEPVTTALRMMSHFFGGPDRGPRWWQVYSARNEAQQMGAG